MRDFSNCLINEKAFFSGAEQKHEIIINGFRYIMKYQKNSEIGLLYNHVSEHIGSNVFAILGIPVQHTLLGTYQGKNVNPEEVKYNLTYTLDEVNDLVKKYNASMGAMISASHNPSEYNGIKLFDGEGFKLPDATENEIEKYLLGKAVPTTNHVGTYEICDTAIQDYVDHIAETAGDINKDLKIVVDCANGSASTTAPLLFNQLGLDATFMNFDYEEIADLEKKKHFSFSNKFTFTICKHNFFCIFADNNTYNYE